MDSLSAAHEGAAKFVRILTLSEGGFASMCLSTGPAWSGGRSISNYTIAAGAAFGRTSLAFSPSVALSVTRVTLGFAFSEDLAYQDEIELVLAGFTGASLPAPQLKSHIEGSQATAVAGTSSSWAEGQTKLSLVVSAVGIQAARHTSVVIKRSAEIKLPAALAPDQPMLTIAATAATSSAAAAAVMSTPSIRRFTDTYLTYSASRPTAATAVTVGFRYDAPMTTGDMGWYRGATPKAGSASHPRARTHAHVCAYGCAPPPPRAPSPSRARNATFVPVPHSVRVVLKDFGGAALFGLMGYVAGADLSRLNLGASSWKQSIWLLELVVNPAGIPASHSTEVVVSKDMGLTLPSGGAVVLKKDQPELTIAAACAAGSVEATPIASSPLVQLVCFVPDAVAAPQHGEFDASCSSTMLPGTECAHKCGMVYIFSQEPTGPQPACSRSGRFVDGDVKCVVRFFGYAVEHQYASLLFAAAVLTLWSTVGVCTVGLVLCGFLPCVSYRRKRKVAEGALPQEDRGRYIADMDSLDWCVVLMCVVPVIGHPAPPPTTPRSKSNTTTLIAHRQVQADVLQNRVPAPAEAKGEDDSSQVRLSESAGWENREDAKTITSTKSTIHAADGGLGAYGIGHSSCGRTGHSGDRAKE